MKADRAVPLWSFVFTCLYFFEYLRPFRRVHIPYDLEGFHYPLAGYIFRSLKEGWLPEWDPWIYCGLSFAGNIQAALFYPPMWLAYLADWGLDHLNYSTLQFVVFAHVWLGFVLSFYWLRNLRLSIPACIFGGGVFAFSGYAMLQLQHFGLIAGYAWIPLGFRGIDEVSERGEWRPMWKVLAASALCFLAGYPPTWVVFAVCMISYALFRRAGWRTALLTGCALAGSLVVCAIQLVPTWHATQMKLADLRYGGGIKDPAFYISYFIPNYFDFGLHRPLMTNFGKEYLYLGAPAFVGIAFSLRRRNLARSLPLVGVAIACFILLTNPFEIPWALIRHSALLQQVVRDWYFLAGITAAAAGLTAVGLDGLLKRSDRRVPAWVGGAVIVGLVAWSCRTLWIWSQPELNFAAGAQAIWEPAITLGLFAAAVWAVRSADARMRRIGLAAMMFAVATDYKGFGTSKRFNATPGAYEQFPAKAPIINMSEKTYALLRSHSDYRVALDSGAPFPLEMRHARLRTPQGFDPLIPAQYRTAVEGVARFRGDNWDLGIDPADDRALQLFGVRYYVTSEYSPFYSALRSSPKFRWVDSSTGYYKVFEYTDAVPPYRWESAMAGRTAEQVSWSPERREFRLRTNAAGRFVVIEQFDAGWNALIDGQPAVMERWGNAFQSIEVPAGEHRLALQYRAAGLRLGALVSAMALVFSCLVLGAGLRTKRGNEDES